MSCCGRNSSSVNVQGAAANPRTLAAQSNANWASVTFEYVGATGLTAVGSVTRRQYIFPESGSKVTADRRDAPSLRAIPALREVR